MLQSKLESSVESLTALNDNCLCSVAVMKMSVMKHVDSGETF